MWIKEIILDGFKSYGQRTELNRFDNKFNAITGLNGSGKSNILDAICFVLGITSLSQVRAGTLQDLIYKSGQAGINRAVVSIIFDNTDTERSPPGFENFTEITITRQVMKGGKTKYLMNGTTVQNKRIHDFFCSIQLNVNNPHFLIMQGRITKVLNMKPAEILAMIEEAAGTRMYEAKRVNTLKTIERKDVKLQELNDVITEEIQPKLDKLRQERSKYLEFQCTERELTHLLNLYQAWQYISSVRAAEKVAAALQRENHRIVEIQDEIVRNTSETTKIDTEITQLTTESCKESKQKLNELETVLKTKEKSEATMNATLKSYRTNVQSQEKRRKDVENVLEADTRKLAGKQQERAQFDDEFRRLQDAVTTQKAAVETAEKRFMALSAGMELNDAGEAQTLLEQLMEMRAKHTETVTQTTVTTNELKNARRQLSVKEQEAKVNSDDYDKCQNDIRQLETDITNRQTQLKRLNYTGDGLKTAQTQKLNLEQDVAQLRDQIRTFTARKPYTQFQYQNPDGNFRRESVIGVVCRLLTIKNAKYNMAIEIAAGSKLFDVVIDDEVTGKKLLENGRLQRRTTFIPLTKIRGNRLNPKIVEQAQYLVGKENVDCAVDLLQYEKRLETVVRMIFGQVLICTNLKMAKQLAFHPKVNVKCVTLEGDVVDPVGILTGGSAPREGPLLTQLSTVLQAEHEMAQKLGTIVDLAKEIDRLTQIDNDYVSKTDEIALKTNRIRLIREHMEMTAFHRQQIDIETLKRNISEAESTLTALQTEKKQLQMKIDDLQGRIKHTDRDKDLKQVKKLLKSAEDDLKTAQDELSRSEKKFEGLNLEISVLEKSLDSYRQQIDELHGELQTLQGKIEEIEQDLESLHGAMSELQNGIQTEKHQILDSQKQCKSRLQRKEELLAANTEHELEIKRIRHKVVKLTDELKLCRAREKDVTGRKDKPNEHYMQEAEKLTERPDGSGGGADLEHKIRSKKEIITKLKRTINTCAQSMIEQQEKEFNEIEKKKKIVETDRRKLIAIIEDLDVKKVNILQVAYQQISRDFGSIFSTLLPGASAKLVIPKGLTIKDGLEVKVQLGGVWSTSLTELSGGQRSLAALSLVLAMLLFKPAPLYILDEVDAALDLSHTQNIGNMLRKHFQNSQFIIVSLKDGMFNNANVLFRTQFIDGVSTVTRTQRS